MDDRQRIATLSTFRSMHARCTDKTHPGHKYYVSKGITVCERWSVFENFLDDMGHRPEGKTIDRIDGDKGYYKDNCRWATPTEQNRNLSSNKLSFDTAVEVAIRRLRGERCEDIAALYEIGKSMPRDIVKGRAWHDAVEMAKKIIEIGNEAMDKELQRLRCSASNSDKSTHEPTSDAWSPDESTVDMWMNGIGGGIWKDGKITLRPDELKSVIRGVASLATKRAALAQQGASQGQAGADDAKGGAV